MAPSTPPPKVNWVSSELGRMVLNVPSYAGMLTYLQFGDFLASEFAPSTLAIL